MSDQNKEKENKPAPQFREWWITGRSDGGMDAFQVPCGDLSEWYNAHHVIEFSALKNLEAKLADKDEENERLKSANEEWKKENLQLEEFNKAYRAELKSLRAKLAERDEQLREVKTLVEKAYSMMPGQAGGPVWPDKTLWEAVSKLTKVE
jgi:septin family protein